MRYRDLIELAIDQSGRDPAFDAARLWPELEREQRAELTGRIDETMGREWCRRLGGGERFARFVAASAVRSPVVPGRRS